jgi:hypothetical protein
VIAPLDGELSAGSLASLSTTLRVREEWESGQLGEHGVMRLAGAVDGHRVSAVAASTSGYLVAAVSFDGDPKAADGAILDVLESGGRR